MTGQVTTRPRQPLVIINRYSSRIGSRLCTSQAEPDQPRNREDATSHLATLRICMPGFEVYACSPAAHTVQILTKLFNELVDQLPPERVVSHRCTDESLS